ncbi:MAG: NGG1p interacting factor NIF3 [Elusimicrobia bacterium RIFOXYB2_FULL_50_12]|nr:MAG: NGG1p interacting factor NIF3 [Elusimicrobia bacterium RIFOXYB2_FULL_50_12]
MKLKELFNFFIEQGIAADPRGAETARLALETEKKKFAALTTVEKEDFDTGRLTNPYLDSRILNGSGEENVNSVLVGIDIETAEIMLAHALKERGRKVDLVLTHHPEGHAYATFYEVIGMQADILHRQGVPINIAESLVESRRTEVGRKVLPQNHARAVDAAKLLELPFISAHTVADNQVVNYLQNTFDTRAPKRLEDIMAILNEMPEYRHAKKNGAGPRIIAGDKESRTGKIFVDMTGGTEGPREAIEKLAAAGVGTIVGMHMSEDHYKEAKKYHLNVVIAGHISSDNVGVNLLLDATEKKSGAIEVIECSGFRRFKR